MPGAVGTPQGSRALVPLLAGIFVLLLLLVVGLGTAAFLGFKAYGDARQSVGPDVVARQDAVAKELRSEAEKDEQKLASFQARLKALYPLPAGPIGKIDHVLQLMLLLNDQLILMNHQMAVLQQSLGRAASPLGSERHLVSGTSDRNAKTDAKRAAPEAHGRRSREGAGQAR